MTAVPLAPSPIRASGLAFAPMRMGQPEIDEVIDGFVRSARHFARGGCDGVEIHGAHGYLLAQFLSPVSNQRDDRYGGDAARRARLLIEVTRAVRQEVGGEAVVGVRLSVDDEIAGGTDPASCREAIDLLRAGVEIDYVSLAVGIKGTYVQDSSASEGVALDRIRAASAGLDVPVIASQRIRTPEQAEDVIATGAADLVGLARALIADPEWPAKARRGEREQIRLCVGDLQDCRTHMSGGLRCMVNPEVGHEAAAARRPRAVRRSTGPRRRVAVVGAGPAGLDFARRAAERGEEVTVYERGAVPGGQLVAAARAPGRGELLDFVGYQVAELDRLGAVLSLRTDVDDVTTIDADRIVVATGATGVRAPGAVHTTWDVVHGHAHLSGNHAVVVDDGRGEWPMITAALLLVPTFRSVTIATSAGSATAGIPGESVKGLQRRLRRAGVQWVVDAAYVGEGPGEALLQVAGTGQELRIQADTIVMESGRTPEDRLWRAGRKGRPDLVAIGDALTPRTVGNAVRDAMILDWRLARADLDSAAYPPERREE